MKVKEMFQAHMSLMNPDINFRVIAGKTNNKVLYSGNGRTFLREEISEMEVWKWFIEGKRNPVFVIVTKPT